MQARSSHRKDLFRACAVSALPASAREVVASLTPETVLAGPGGRPDRVVIDPVMAKLFSELEADLMARVGTPRVTDGSLPQAVTTPFHDWIQDLAASADPLILLDDYGRIVSLQDPEGEIHGFAALLGDGIENWYLRGMILDCDLAVDPVNRGYGIGRALVAAQLLYGEGLPTWEHDKPGYSPAGAITVFRGMELAQRLAREIEAEIRTPGPDL